MTADSAGIIAQATQQADTDAPLEALATLRAAGLEQHPDAGPLMTRLRAHVDHLESPDAYAAFYAADVPERPFLPLARLASLHQTMPRCAVVRQLLHEHGARRVLECGCYDGFILLHLALTERVRGVGIDLAPHAIAEAQRRAEAYRLPLEFRVGFIESLELPDRYDAVLLLEVLEHVRDPVAVLEACERHVTPEGLIYVSVPLDVPPHTGWRERKEHVRHYTERALSDLLASRGTLHTHARYWVPDGWAQIAMYRP